MLDAIYPIDIKAMTNIQSPLHTNEHTARHLQGSNLPAAFLLRITFEVDSHVSYIVKTLY
jgi:hypothetical protein